MVDGARSAQLRYQSRSIYVYSKSDSGSPVTDVYPETVMRSKACIGFVDLFSMFFGERAARGQACFVTAV